jgi:hypothetical protein
MFTFKMLFACFPFAVFIFKEFIILLCSISFLLFFYQLLHHFVLTCVHFLVVHSLIYIFYWIKYKYIMHISILSFILSRFSFVSIISDSVCSKSFIHSSFPAVVSPYIFSFFYYLRPGNDFFLVSICLFAFVFE